MEFIYFVSGLFIFWYVWWGDRRRLEEILNYYAAAIGFGGSKMYYPSIVALIFSIYIFYGVLMFR